MARHPNKQIRSALEYAEKHGWAVELSNGYPWGEMKCPKNKNCRDGNFCRVSIWSTPRNPQNHAKRLKKVVDKCEFLSDDEGDDDD